MMPSYYTVFLSVWSSVHGQCFGLWACRLAQLCQFGSATGGFKLRRCTFGSGGRRCNVQSSVKQYPRAVGCAVSLPVGLLFVSADQQRAVQLFWPLSGSVLSVRLSSGRCFGRAAVNWLRWTQSGLCPGQWLMCCVPLFSRTPFCQCGFSRGRCSCDVSFQCGAVDRAVVLCCVPLFSRAPFNQCGFSRVGAVVM